MSTQPKHKLCTFHRRLVTELCTFGTSKKSHRADLSVKGGVLVDRRGGAKLLGSVLITKLYLSALERQEIPEEERRDFYLYIDEFHAFSADIFPSILSEARKYRLSLTLVHQYLDQIPRDIRNSVFGNIGT